MFKFGRLLAGLAILTLTVMLSTAQAAPRHHHRHRHLASAESSRPSAWCGWFMAQHLGISGKVARWLWVARNWAQFGSPAPGPQVGSIVVWRHHVGQITAVRGSSIRVLSGNDGHAVRDRWRTLRGVIAFRWPPPNSWASI
ncbi:CHAP domain-containing protein [Bradyrhizobium sp. SZCCHNS1012]|uniref:CHAP domain-containing protein n=1 Tax=Bradyrhizobium sp. SZCCHNS1012 TaxID=3057297 RepID=UPI0029169353|nr:CHAP domain-containing protein [Bradyrhizobium sp. SZCCHNS1012]